MKRFGTIFASVIFILLIMLIPNNKVKAINLNGVEVELPDGVNITTDSVVIGYNKDDSNKYMLAVYHGELKDAIMDAGYKLYIGNGWNNFYHYTYSNGSWDEGYSSYGYQTIYKDYIFYSNVNIYNYAKTELIYEADDIITESAINITSSFACDSNGKDMEYITIDFSDYGSENYTYQYAIKYVSDSASSAKSWVDIEELSNYTYSFNEYYNQAYIYARVLDSENNEIAIAEYKIENDALPKFEMKITSSLACPVPNYDNDPLAEIIQIDLTNCYNENYTYEYSYDSRTYHKLNVNSSEKIYYLNEYLGLHITFRVLNENNNVIYWTFGKRTTDFVSNHDYKRGYAYYSESVANDLEGNKVIVLTMDFRNITTFVNEYNFDVVINGVSYGEIQYKEIILTRENYQQFFDVKIYVDKMLVHSKKYALGNLSDDLDFDSMYDNIQNSDMGNLDLNVGDVASMKELYFAFLTAISSFIATFFDLLFYAFESLNIWLRACILCLFIEYIVTRIIKVARKK